MPSVSKKQAGLMRLCSSTAGRKNAKGKCPSKKVARDFRAADVKQGYRSMGSARP